MTLLKKIGYVLGGIVTFFAVGYAMQLPIIPLGLRYIVAALQFLILVAVVLALVIYSARSMWRSHRFESFLLLLMSLFFAIVSLPTYLPLIYYYATLATAQVHAKAPSNPEEFAEHGSEFISYLSGKAAFEQMVASSARKPAAIKLSAKWCGPCKKLKPVYEVVAQELHEKITFGEVDIDLFDDKSLLTVPGVPTILMYKNGQEIGRIVGFRTAEELTAEFKKLEM
ncbi:MAG TPA: thioredoxin domain-containing protein [Candidatus Babeliales bacterium]|nr:thioredoxin domain-containing protein [Candidatus Babeliales bacterium]